MSASAVEPEHMVTVRRIHVHEIFRVLGDEVRWRILCEAARVEELPGRTLDRSVGLSRSTISYHLKMLTNSGCLVPRKQGREYFYRIDRDVFRALIADMDHLSSRS